MKKDNSLSLAVSNKQKAQRGLTSVGKKSLGIKKKGKGSEKTRHSRNANVKRKVKKNRKKLWVLIFLLVYVTFL